MEDSTLETQEVTSCEDQSPTYKTVSKESVKGNWKKVKEDAGGLPSTHPPQKTSL